MIAFDLQREFETVSLVIMVYSVCSGTSIFDFSLICLLRFGWMTIAKNSAKTKKRMALRMTNLLFSYFNISRKG